MEYIIVCPFKWGLITPGILKVSPDEKQNLQDALICEIRYNGLFKEKIHHANNMFSMFKKDR